MKKVHVTDTHYLDFDLKHVQLDFQFAGVVRSNSVRTMDDGVGELSTDVEPDSNAVGYTNLYLTDLLLFSLSQALPLTNTSRLTVLWSNHFVPIKNTLACAPCSPPAFVNAVSRSVDRRPS
jgi:hypothetical protein